MYFAFSVDSENSDFTVFLSIKECIFKYIIQLMFTKVFHKLIAHKTSSELGIIFLEEKLKLSLK